MRTQEASSCKGQNQGDSWLLASVSLWASLPAWLAAWVQIANPGGQGTKQALSNCCQPQ